MVSCINDVLRHKGVAWIGVDGFCETFCEFERRHDVISIEIVGDNNCLVDSSLRIKTFSSIFFQSQKDRANDVVFRLNRVFVVTLFRYELDWMPRESAYALKSPEMNA